MQRQFFTAEDIQKLHLMNQSEVLMLGAFDIITQEAEELASALGVRLMRESSAELPPPPSTTSLSNLPPLKVIRGASVNLEPFGAELPGNSASVNLKDVITSSDGASMAAGYMTVEKGDFHWTLTYDEIDIILEGELTIKRGGDQVCGRAGDMIFIPKNSSISFSAVNRVRFAYVTWPADWNSK